MRTFRGTLTNVLLPDSRISSLQREAMRQKPHSIKALILMMRHGQLLIVISVAAMMGCQGPGNSLGSPTFVTAHESSPFGVNTHLITYQQGDPLLGLSVQKMASAGVLWDRDSFYYATIESAEGQFNWQPFDDVVNKDLNSGINVLGLLCFGAMWWNTPVNDKEMSPLTDQMLNDWSDFVRTVVERYKDQVHYWEIWNEENTAMFWSPQPNPSDYVRLLKAAHDVITSVASGSKIVMGGTAFIDTNYIQQVYNNGGGSYFNILAVHPYEEATPDSYTTGSSYPSDFVKSIADLNAQFPGKPIWLTEMGWPTSSTSDQLQADYLVRMYVQMLSLSEIQKVFWYDFCNDATGDPSIDTMGLVQRDSALSPKIGYYAYQTMAHLLQGASFQNQVQGPNIDSGNGLGDDIYQYRFVNGNKTVVAIWISGQVSGTGTSVTRSVTVNNVTASSATLVTLSGSTQTLTVVNGQYNVTASQAPLYLVFSP